MVRLKRQVFRFDPGPVDYEFSHVARDFPVDPDTIVLAGNTILQERFGCEIHLKLVRRQFGRPRSVQ